MMLSNTTIVLLRNFPIQLLYLRFPVRFNNGGHEIDLSLTESPEHSSC